MESKTSRSTLTLLFIASLLVHGTLALLILTIKYAQENPHKPAEILFYEDKSVTAPPTMLAQEQPISEQTAEHPQPTLAPEQTKPADNDFFKNFPTILPNATGKNTAVEEPQSMPGQELISAPIENEAHQNPQDTVQEAEQQDTPPLVDEKKIEEIGEYGSNAPTLIQEQKTINEAKKTISANKQTAEDGSYGVDTQAKKLSLADIAHSFLVEAKNNQQAFQTSAHIEGDSSQLPTGKHFAFARYWEKINHHVIRELQLHIAQYREVCTNHWPQEFYLRGTMTLSKDGTIIAATLTSSTGNPDLDAFLFATLHSASSSFPPIPNSLGQETLNVPWHWPLPKPEQQSRLRRI